MVSKERGIKGGRTEEEGREGDRPWALNGDAVSIWGVESAGDWGDDGGRL